MGVAVGKRAESRVFVLKQHFFALLMQTKLFLRCRSFYV
jgi:hypothetical protein